jgi:hypothetical protein
MGGRCRAVFFFPIVLLLAIPACASHQKPLPPPVDPLKEEVTILQKQLLELQNSQNETSRKVDEQTSLTKSLDARIQALETQRSVPPAPPVPDLSSSQKRPTSAMTSQKHQGKKNKTSSRKRKTTRTHKKKPVRRVEQ